MREQAADDPDVLVLGAGINGACLARELALNGASVMVVDADDVASGTTRWSTRLVHGGLRYLEYGELALVRESLIERERLCRLAPHLVRPLGFSIPLRGRLGGLASAAARIVGWETLARRLAGSRGRGSLAVGCGLTLYDLLGAGSGWPRHRIVGAGLPGLPRVDPVRYPLAGLYTDAQMLFPERFTVELLVDARRIAVDRGLGFQVLTRHQALCRADGRVEVGPLGGAGRSVIAPRAVVNATGAWVDRTLDDVWPALDGMVNEHVRLIGGTKGSHLLIDHPPLRVALGPRGVYAEATDGRPVFVLPFGARLVLVGTTDIPFAGDPATARASPEEIEYLLAAVGGLFPTAAPSQAHVMQHYCGVRPLPARRPGGRSPAGITRRHMLVRMEGAPVPTWSIIGGKLTTCRSLAAQAAKEVLSALAIPVTASSRCRPLPGAPEAPSGEASGGRDAVALLVGEGVPEARATRLVAETFALFGARACGALGLNPDGKPTPEGGDRTGAVLVGTPLPVTAVGFCIDQEWARTLEDLIERRLMLVYSPDLSRATLSAVAGEMVRLGAMPAGRVDAEVDSLARLLAERYGKRLA
jgi:glycerol-3-phosphate dehydrogenase